MTPDAARNHKNRLRKNLRFDNDCRLPAWNAAHKTALAARVMTLVTGEIAPGGVIGVYDPLPDEVDCRPLFPLLLQQGYRLALPCVSGPVFGAQRPPLVFRAWDGVWPEQAIHDDEEADAAPRRIHMPPATAMTLQPDLLLVPLLGFNAQLYRLGRGGGHYDVTLDALPHVPTIGLAAACQQVDFVAEAHDKALHRVVTEQGILSQPVLSHSASPVILSP